MVHNPKDRYTYEKARQLRSRGLSYNEIREELGIAKSNISLWCRDIQLTKPQLARLEKHSFLMVAQKLGSKANKEKREKEIVKIVAQAKQEITRVSRESYMIAGAIMYWAEGSKHKNLSVCNSDPRIIEFMVNWFSRILNVGPERLKAHVHIHYGNDDLRIKKYWSKLTDIPLKNFGKSFIKPKGTGHRTHILPNGIIKVRVSGKGVTNQLHRVLAWSQKFHELSKSTPSIA